MLSKLRRLYRGLCWLMDTDCGMPWDMASLGEVRKRVETLEQEVTDVNTYATDLGDRTTALEEAESAKAMLPLPSPRLDPEPAICSPLTKIGLTATTMAHFVAMARYVVETGAIVEGLRGRQPIDMVTAIANALQAYAKGAR